MKCVLDEKTTTDVLIQQLRKEVEELMNTTTARLLAQDGKIASVCCYIKENLSATLVELMETMKVSGELNALISDVVLAYVMEIIEQNNCYFESITCERKYDDSTQTYYYVTTIPKTDCDGKPIRLKLGIANDNHSVNTVESTLDFAHRKNASVCINAGVYDVNTKLPLGSVIKDGEIIYTAIPPEDDKYQYLAIMSDGSIRTYDKGTTPYKMVSDGVKDATCIFGSLIVDGEWQPQTDVREEPRQTIGIKPDGTIIIITCDGRRPDSEGMTYTNMIHLHNQYGSYNAYILDGGGSTSTVVRGIKQNENVDNFKTDRAVSSFLYVSKDIKMGEHNNANNDIGKVKQYLMEKINTNVDFLRGFIRLRGQENYYATGIEFYVNNENSRRSKVGLSIDPNNPRNSYFYISFNPGTGEKTNMIRIYGDGCLIQCYHGASSERPNATIGCCYFDTNLNKPIWYDGSNWRDAQGLVV